MKKIYFRFKWFIHFLPTWLNWLAYLAIIALTLVVWSHYYQQEQQQTLQNLEHKIIKIQKGITAMNETEQANLRVLYQDNLLPAEDAEKFLKSMLLTNKGLTLVTVTKLPPTTFGDPVTKQKKKQSRGRRRRSKKKTVKKTQALAGPTAYKKLIGARFVIHPVTIVFKGNYAATLTYLQQLENAKEPIYYRSIEYTVEKAPVALVKLTVYTLSKQKEWFRD